MWKIFQRIRNVLSSQVIKCDDHLNCTGPAKSTCVLVNKFRFCSGRSNYNGENNNSKEKRKQSQGKDAQREFYSYHFCPILETIGAIGFGTTILIGLQFVTQKHIWGPRRTNLNEVLNCIAFSNSLRQSPLRLGILSDQKPSTSNEKHTEDDDNLAFDSEDFETGEDNLVFDCENFETGDSNGPKIEKDDEHNSIFSKLELDKILAENNPYISDVQNQVGLGLSTIGRPEEALDYFKAACELGERKACFNVGICYESGLGAEKDLDKAKEFYQKAAELGHPGATYNLGVIYVGSDNESEFEKGVELMEMAANMGEAQAQKFLGIHYLEREEMDRAFEFLTLAVENQDSDSQYYLGLCYEYGWGVEKNLASAADLYSKAAKTGHLDATYNLAIFHELGLGGLPENSTAALELFRHAAKGGHQESIQKISANFSRINRLTNSASDSKISHILNNTPIVLNKSHGFSDLRNQIFSLQSKNRKRDSVHRSNDDEFINYLFNKEAVTVTNF